MLDVFLYGVLPYVAVVTFLGTSIQRYRREPFTFSSLSSQFLESRRLFWGSVPFHMGILTLFFGHLIGFLFPMSVTIWNGEPARLLILESTALAAALLTTVGLIGLIYRRIATTRLWAITTPTDIMVYVALLFSIATGLWVALGLRWGSAWYTHTIVPYLWSILKFQPDIQRVAELPLAARLHFLAAVVLFGLFSFTRLVHILVTPVPYLWRPVQQVIWNRARAR
ncbi:MAG: respiratory nitrate reductase subunit gamma, partial [Candidatus Latescibacteria bacterium]|nr:respiratory nitrate reductase subunit gamma [Candidatus Latescibacterota bacterium]